MVNEHFIVQQQNCGTGCPGMYKMPRQFHLLKPGENSNSYLMQQNNNKDG
jgi:hypothetical protein